MPQVPYQPFASEQASSQGAPSISVNAPVAAFGGATGQALSHLGAQLEKSGDELFNRAIAIQQLRDESLAREADADYTERAGLLHAEYNSLQGKSAVEAFPKYMENLRNTREELREGLQGDYARRIYDTSSRSTMGRTIFNGAGHAATSGKKWAVDASTARVAGWKDVALSAPHDDISFKASLDGLREEIETRAAVGGWGPEQTDHAMAEEVSGLWSNRIVGLARTQPWAAKDMLEKNRTKILGQHMEKVDKVVDQHLVTTGSRNISDAVNNGWAPYMTQRDADRSVGVDDTLMRIVKKAQRDNPDLQFTIGGQGGRRTVAEQADIVARGNSKTMHSDHLTGRAIDLVPLTNGQPDYKSPQYPRLIEAMQKASEELGIPLKAKSKAFTGWDPGHYALPEDYDVRKAGKVPEEPLQNRMDRAADYAKRYMPESTIFADAVRDRVMTDFNRTKTVKRDFEYANKNTLEGALVGGFGNGKIPTTKEELVALDPKVEAAWENLDETAQRRYLKALATNAKGDQAWSSDSLRRYQELKGMAQAEPKEFLETDVISEKFPNRARLELINLQQKLKANAEQDPRVGKALQILRPDLSAAGIDRTSNKARYDQFVGALQDQLEEFQKQNNKAPKADEVRQIGARLMQDQSSGWFPWSKTPTFELSVPADEIAKIKADPAWKELGIEPSDPQIQRIYTRRKYQELYGKSIAKDTPFDGPKPPISR